MIVNKETCAVCEKKLKEDDMGAIYDRDLDRTVAWVCMKCFKEMDGDTVNAISEQVKKNNR